MEWARQEREAPPAFKGLHEVFSSINPYVKDAPCVRLRREKHGREWAENRLSQYVNVRVVETGAFSARNVEATPALVAFLRENMILVNYDTIFFKVSVYADGTSRVWASYGQIIGSRFLCELTPEETQLFTDSEEVDNAT
jgi:hypothetical protein